MIRVVIPLLVFSCLLTSGCPDDKCHRNDDCIDGYACNLDGNCEEIEPLKIANESMRDAVVGELYQVDMQATGGLTPYTWSLESDETWLSVQASTGILSGTPTSAKEDVSLTINLLDGSMDGLSTSRTYMIDVLFCEESQQGPCSGHGTCSSSGVCSCDAGYAGDQCEGCAGGYHLEINVCVQDETCEENSCNGHGDCDDSTGGIVCDCQDEYTGQYCDTCSAGHHPEDDICVEDEVCLSNSCGGHGDCDDSTGQVVCTCDLGYTGQYCDDCDEGYHPDGQDCEEDEACPSENPCSGHGTCDDSTGVAICTCDTGYDGLQCESCADNYHPVGDICVENEVCMESSCFRHGDCDDTTGVIVCSCYDGYTGLYCDDCESGYHPVGPDCEEDIPCPSVDPCSGHGTCDDSSGIPVCTCEQGYDGDMCESCASGYHDEGGVCVLDEQCDVNSCSGHGDCDDSTGSVICSCYEGYDGDFCDLCSQGFHEYEGECCKLGECVETRLSLSIPEGNERFGNSVAIEGEYIVVGAPGCAEAYVYRCYSVGNCDDGTRLSGYKIPRVASFGKSVAINGNYVIVGAAFGESAYVFRRIGTNSWDIGEKLTSPAGQDGDKFGFSVSIDGDYAVVGAYTENLEQGAAYVFRRTGQNSWDSGTRLDNGSSSIYFFGLTVDIDGDYAVVGNFTDSGVFFFRRTGLSTWDDVTSVFPADAQVGSFGSSVSIRDEYAIVGSPGNGPEGAAYVLKRTGDNTWIEYQKLTAIDAQAGDDFGWAVSLGSEYAVVGSYYEDSAASDAGAAYVYRLNDEQMWEPWAKVTASDAQYWDGFGGSVATDDNRLVVGSKAEDGGTGDPFTDTGAAYIYY